MRRSGRVVEAVCLLHLKSGREGGVTVTAALVQDSKSIQPVPWPSLTFLTPHRPTMPPRLDEPTSSWRDDFSRLTTSSLSWADRWATLRGLALRSVRIRIGEPLLPLRVRPAFIVLNVIDLLILGLLGFHPNGQAWLRLNDKVLHFVCFFFATFLFYMVWDVDESARRSWLWRHAALLLTFVTCFAVGGIGSEFVQSLLPYKIFQWGDVFANLLGSSLGLFFSYHLELRYRARRELEQLYAPLDIEDYADADADAAAALSHQSQGATNKKNVRFADVWDDEIDEDHSPPLAPAPAPASAPASAPAPAKKTPQNLFSIYDEDDNDDDNNPLAEGSSSTWRDGQDPLRAT